MRPFVGPISDLTESNTAYRRVIFTGRYLQLVLMSLAPGESIGSEVHRDVDQFFRIEEGAALFVLGAGSSKRSVRARTDDAIVVPAGLRHDVRNPSRTKALKLYTIYAPPEHPPGTVHRTKSAATRRGR